MIFKSCLLGLLMVWFIPQLMAGAIAFRLGPPAIGRGGPNPVSIPPAAGDIGLSYITDKKLEFNFAATGLSIATRSSSSWGGYSSVGAGLAFSGNGVGFGPYAAFGIEKGCGSWIGCFSSEVTQALGLGFGAPVSPTSWRIGVVKWF